MGRMGVSAQRRPTLRHSRSRFVRLILVSGLVAGAITTTAAPSAAAARWTITPSVSPPGAPIGDLSAVSCSSPTSCFAIGHNDSGDSSSPLTERWDGTSWSIVPGPKTSANTTLDFSAVSCSSATSCFAVGTSESESETSFQLKTLVARWNGTSWTIVPSPKPKGATEINLSGVWCSSATDCFAVGGYSMTSFPSTLFLFSTLIEHWNGSTWSIVANPNPAAFDSELRGVSCSSASDCFAVGDFVGHGSGGTLIEHWNGRSWSIVAGPSPSAPVTTPPGPRTGGDFVTPGLESVSCSTVTSCFAVGASSTGPLVEQWDGATWSIVTIPVPPGVSSVELNGVSCSSPTDCAAVGDSFTVTSNGGPFGEEIVKPLSERWDGTTWSIVAGPKGSPFSSLQGVSCPSATSCAAVGDSAAVQRWDGARWSMASFATSTSQSELDGVSCPSATSCFAVGTYQSPSNGRTLVEHWNGTRWSIVPSPTPKGSLDAKLFGVSCPTATSCNAVGVYETASSQKPLIEHWNGTRWSIAAAPNAPGVELSELFDVSCPTTSNCNAVGLSFSEISAHTLTEHYNGKRWSIVASPSPKGAVLVELIGISCPSPTSCTAVGNYATVTPTLFGVKTLVEQWDGTTWSIVPSPNPPGERFADLTGVSCPNPTSCTAVGTVQPPSGNTQSALIEHWNGTTWTVVPAPKPTGSTADDLTGVACRSARSCYAVGGSSDASASKTLVEHWNGSGWSIVATASPKNARDTTLIGVACGSSAGCIAVGAYSAAGGSFTLTERGT